MTAKRSKTTHRKQTPSLRQPIRGIIKRMLSARKRCKSSPNGMLYFCASPGRPCPCQCEFSAFDGGGHTCGGVRSIFLLMFCLSECVSDTSDWVCCVLFCCQAVPGAAAALVPSASHAPATSLKQFGSRTPLPSDVFAVDFGAVARGHKSNQDVFACVIHAVF